MARASLDVWYVSVVLEYVRWNTGTSCTYTFRPALGIYQNEVVLSAVFLQQAKVDDLWERVRNMNLVNLVTFMKQSSRCQNCSSA